MDGMVNGFAQVGEATDGLKVRFGLLEKIATAAIFNITNRLMDWGLSTAHDALFGNLMAGLSGYEHVMERSRNIYANAGAMFGRTMDDVSAAIEVLRDHASVTIFTIEGMTDALKGMAQSRVDLEPATRAIMGFANAGAYVGASASEVDHALKILARSMSGGIQNLTEWDQIYRNIGGVEFVNTLLDAAIAVGDLDEATADLVRTGEVHIRQLQNMNKSQGGLGMRFSGEALQMAAEMLYANEAMREAATRVQTLTRLREQMNTVVAKGWIESWQLVIGDVEQSAELFTGISNWWTSIVKPISNARNEMLRFWNQAGGRSDVIEGVANIFSNLGDVVTAVTMAFRNVFPAMTGERLVQLSSAFREFTERLTISDRTLINIRRTMEGFFAALNIVFSILGVGVRILGFFIGALRPVVTVIFSVTGALGDLTFALNHFLQVSGVFRHFTDTIRGAMEMVGGFIGLLLGQIPWGTAIDLIDKGFTRMIMSIGGFGRGLSNLDIFSDLFGGITSGISSFINSLGSISYSGAAGVLRALRYMLSGFVSFITAVPSLIRGSSELIIEALISFRNGLDMGSTIGRLTATIVNLLIVFVRVISTVASGLWESVMRIGRAIGAFGEIDVRPVRRFTSETERAFNPFASIATAFNKAVNSIVIAARFLQPHLIAIGHWFAGWFRIVADTFKESGFQGVMQLVNALLNLGWLLAFRSFIKSLGGVNGILGGFKKVLAETQKSLRAFQAGVRAKSLKIIATSVLMLAGALVLLSAIPIDELGPALLILGGLLVAVVAALGGFMAIASKFGMKGVVKLKGLGAALIGLSVAILILSRSLNNLEGVKWSEIGQGIIIIIGVLVAFAVTSLALKKAVPAMLAMGVSIISLSIGLAGFLLVARLATLLFPRLAETIVEAGRSIMSFMAANPFQMTLVILGLAAALKFVAPSLLLFGAGLALTGVGLLLFSASILTALIALELISKVLPGVRETIANFFSSFKGTSGLATVAMFAKMALVVVGLSAAFIILGKGIAVLSIGMLKLGAAVALLSGGILLGAIAFTLLGAALAPLIPQTRDFVEGLVGIFENLSFRDVALLSAKIGLLSLAMTILGVALVAVSVGGLLSALMFTALAGGVTLITTAIRFLVDTITDILSELSLMEVGLGRTAAVSAVFLASSLLIGTALMTIGAAALIAAPGITLLSRGLYRASRAIERTAYSLDKLSDFSNIGEAIGQGVTLSLLSETNDAVRATRVLASAIHKAFIGYFEIKSPSRLMYRTTSRIVEGLVNSLVDGIPGAERAMNRLGVGMFAGAEKFTKDALRFGGNVAGALAFGVQNGSRVVLEGARTLGSTLLGGIRSALGINSPSIYGLYIGYSIPNSVAMGIDDYSHVATTAAYTMASGIYEAATSYMDRYDAVAEEMEERSEGRFRAWRRRRREEREAREDDAGFFSNLTAQFTAESNNAVDRELRNINHLRRIRRMSFEEEFAEINALRLAHAEGSTERSTAERAMVDAVIAARKANEISKEREYELLSQLLEYHLESTEQRMRVEIELFDLQQRIRDATWQEEEELLRHRRHIGELTIEDELLKWAEMAAIYEEGTDERIRLERRMYQAVAHYRQLGVLAMEEEYNVWAEIMNLMSDGATQRQSIERRQFDIQRSIIEERDRLEMSSLETLEDSASARSGARSIEASLAENSAEAINSAEATLSDGRTIRFGEEMRRIEHQRRIMEMTVDEELALLDEIRQAHFSNAYVREQADNRLFEAIVRNRNAGQIKMEEEYELWLRLQADFEVGTENRKRTEVELFDLRQRMLTEQRDADRNYILHRRRLEQKSFEQEVNEWTRRQTYFINGTAERKQADRDLFDAIVHHREMGNVSMRQEYELWYDLQKQFATGTEERKRVEIELFDLRNRIHRADVEEERATLLHRRRLTQTTVEEELALWDRHRKSFAIGAEERIRAERDMIDSIVHFRDRGIISMDEEVKHWFRLKNQFVVGTEERKRVEVELHDLRLRMLDEYQRISDERIRLTNAIQAAEQRYHDAHVRMAQEQTRIRDRMTQAERRYQDELNNRTRSIARSFGLFDEFSRSEEVLTGEDLINRLQGTNDELEDWLANLGVLTARGMDEGLIEELRAKGVSANHQLAAIVDMTDDELAKYQELWGRRNEMARNEATEQLRGLREETLNEIQELQRELDELPLTLNMYQLREEVMTEIQQLIADIAALPRIDISIFGDAGYEAGEAFTEALEDQVPYAEEAGEEVTNAAYEGLKYNEEEYEAIGIRYGEDFSDALASKERLANRAGRDVSQAAIQGLRTGEREPARIGQAFAQGFINAMNGMTVPVTNSASTLARAALEAFQATLRVNSPSEETYATGRWFAIGFINAIVDSTKAMIGVVKAFGKSAVDETMETLAELWEDFDTNPTIKPVLDLSEIQNGSRKLTKMLKDGDGLDVSDTRRTAVEISGRMRGDQRSEADEVKSEEGRYWKFEQHNHSPKPLNRLEIYRNTKSLFAQQRGLVEQQ